MPASYIGILANATVDSSTESGAKLPLVHDVISPSALTKTQTKAFGIYHSIIGATVGSLKPVRSLLPRLEAAVKPTQINIKNNLSNDILISPIKSSVGRQNFMTNIANGATKSIRDSNGGSGNYDLEFSIKVLAPGKPDELIGEFRADNPWFYPYYVEALTKNIWYSQSRSESDPWIINDKQYLTNYKDGRQETDKGDKGMYGKADEDKMITRSDSDDPTIEYYYTQAKNGAYDKSIPCIEVENLGVVDGAKTWNFTVQSWI